MELEPSRRKCSWKLSWKLGEVAGIGKSTGKLSFWCILEKSVSNFFASTYIKICWHERLWRIYLPPEVENSILRCCREIPSLCISESRGGSMVSMVLVSDTIEEREFVPVLFRSRIRSKGNHLR